MSLKSIKIAIIIGGIIAIALVVASIFFFYTSSKTQTNGVPEEKAPLTKDVEGGEEPIAQRPTFTLGYRLTFTDLSYPPTEDWDLVYRGKQDGLLVFEHIRGDQTFNWLFTPDITKVRTEGRHTEILYNPDRIRLRFPLFVSKSWSQQYTIQREGLSSRLLEARLLEARVLAYEKITVPAGTFWAYKIEAVNYLSGDPLPSYETYWYAPEVGYLIKYQSPDLHAEYELLRYSTPKSS